MMETLIKKAPNRNYFKDVPDHYTDYKNKDWLYSYNFRSLTFEHPHRRDIIRSILVDKVLASGEPNLLSKDFAKIVGDEVLLDIVGKQYQLPYSLKHIANQIKEAEEILHYDFDWDDEGALPTDVPTFENAVSFVIDYAISIFKHYGVILKTPYIDILKDGSVSVHWETERAQFLMIFKKEESGLAYYYAERKDNKVPLKSAIEPGKPIDEFLALWMKTNLT